MKKSLTLIAALIVIIGSIVYLEYQKPDLSEELANSEIVIGEQDSNSLSVSEKAKKYQRAKELVSPGEFFNTKDNLPITIKENIGKKIILVDFWTYSCINCQRTFPFLKAWHEKYEDEGLLIFGVHSPEFDFEKDPNNVQDALNRFGIKYPVVQDNDFGTWKAYQNRFWPRKYIIDIDGFVVYDHVGEGAYDETERKIQELLAEKADRDETSNQFKRGNLVNPENQDSRSSNNISPEVYFGAWRNEFLKNGPVEQQLEQEFSLPEDLENEGVYFSGKWKIENKFAQNMDSPASIVYPFQARDVFMVAAADSPVRAQIFVDNEVISNDIKGGDIDENGFITFEKERLYKLVKGNDSSNFKTLEIRVESAGFKAFTFTFG